MQNSLYMLFEHKCALEICLHIHPIIIKIHPVFFFSSILKSPSSNQAVLRVLSEWCSSAQTTPTIVDWQVRLTLDPPWVSWELSASSAGEDQMSLITRLRCFVVGCNNEQSSRRLWDSLFFHLTYCMFRYSYNKVFLEPWKYSKMIKNADSGSQLLKNTGRERVKTRC